MAAKPPKCSICKNGRCASFICDSCKADPANVDWFAGHELEVKLDPPPEEDGAPRGPNEAGWLPEAALSGNAHNGRPMLSVPFVDEIGRDYEGREVAEKGCTESMRKVARYAQVEQLTGKRITRREVAEANPPCTEKQVSVERERLELDTGGHLAARATARRQARALGRVYVDPRTEERRRRSNRSMRLEEAHIRRASTRDLGDTDQIVRGAWREFKAALGYRDTVPEVHGHGPNPPALFRMVELGLAAGDVPEGHEEADGTIRIDGSLSRISIFDSLRALLDALEDDGWLPVDGAGHRAAQLLGVIREADERITAALRRWGISHATSRTDAENLQSRSAAA